MRVWSRMTLALAAGAWMVPASFCPAETADLPAAPTAVKAAKPADSPTAATAAEAPASSAKGRTVKLTLQIGGLGDEGCDVEVKPGNAACRFKTQTGHVTNPGELTLVIREIELRGVDRNCTFAIVVREKGQAPKTVYRGFRLAAAPKGNQPESFICFMSCPSKVAGLAREGRVVR